MNKLNPNVVNRDKLFANRPTDGEFKKPWNEHGWKALTIEKG